MCRLIGVESAPPIEGELDLTLNGFPDMLSHDAYPTRLVHRSLMSAGGYDATASDPDRALAMVRSVDGVTRAAATHHADAGWSGGAVAWVRGTSACAYLGGDLISGAGHLPTADDPATIFHGDLLMRFALDRLGWRFGVAKRSAAQRNPITCVSRHDNGFYFCGYVPDMTVEMQLGTPHGAAVFVGCDAEIAGKVAHYRMPRAWRRECRLFVEQSGGVVSCHEKTAEMIGLRRRLLITGLSNAKIRFFPEADSPLLSLVLNGSYPYFEGPFVDTRLHNAGDGAHLLASGLSGSIVVGW